MSQPPTTSVSSSPRAASALPKGPLTTEQKLEALRRVQQQAEKRVQVGMQLFEAAEHQSRQQRRALDQIRTEQQRLAQWMQEDRKRVDQQITSQAAQLRKELADQQEHIKDQVAREVASSLQSYDQWMGQMDERLTHRIQSLENSLARLHDGWAHAQDSILGMMRRTDSMLDQARIMISDAQARLDRFEQAMHQPAISVPHDLDDVLEQVEDDAVQVSVAQAHTAGDAQKADDVESLDGDDGDGEAEPGALSIAAPPTDQCRDGGDKGDAGDVPSPALRRATLEDDGFYMQVLEMIKRRQSQAAHEASVQPEDADGQSDDDAPDRDANQNTAA